MSTHKREDWKCNCGASNFASRDKCFICDDFKSKSIKKETHWKKGDWNCPSCHEINFASRSDCRKCFLPKTNTNNIMAPIGREHGDWQCIVCKNPKWNFGSRQTCRNCGADKNVLQINNLNKPSECVVCMDRPITIAFTSCGHMGTCDVCCYAMDKCPICRAPYNTEQILKVFFP
jgi:hypothetical protein